MHVTTRRVLFRVCSCFCWCCRCIVPLSTLHSVGDYLHLPSQNQNSPAIVVVLEDNESILIDGFYRPTDWPRVGAPPSALQFSSVQGTKYKKPTP